MTPAERRRAYIKRVVAAAPPLTPDQWDRLAPLLRCSKGGTTGVAAS